MRCLRKPLADTRSTPESFRRLYELLDAAIDPGSWWPAETHFEIGVGAILTQNTAWNNVEQAIDALDANRLLTPTGIAAVDINGLKELIRPAGFMNAKATYLKNFTTWYLANYTTAGELHTDQLRKDLMAVHGIGPETADVLMLYVYERPVFIWDTYARRLLVAAGYEVPKDYEAARRALTAPMLASELTTAEHQRFHGLIVQAGKYATAAGGWEHYWHQLHH